MLPEAEQICFGACCILLRLTSTAQPPPPPPSLWQCVLQIRCPINAGRTNNKWGQCSSDADAYEMGHPIVTYWIWRPKERTWFSINPWQGQFSCLQSFVSVPEMCGAWWLVIEVRPELESCAKMLAGKAGFWAGERSGFSVKHLHLGVALLFSTSHVLMGGSF